MFVCWVRCESGLEPWALCKFTLGLQDTKSGRQKAGEPTKRRNMAKVISDDDEEEENKEEEDVIDLSYPAPVCPVQLDCLHLELGESSHVFLMHWCPHSLSGSCIPIACTAASLDDMSRASPYAAGSLSRRCTVSKGGRVCHS